MAQFGHWSIVTLDNVHVLAKHREAKAERGKIKDEPNPLLSHLRIQAITNAPVRITVARLLYELGVNYRTLQPDDSRNSAICEIDQSLINDNCASMDDYILTVGREMRKLTSIQPRYLRWSPNAKTGITTVAYIR